MQLFKENSYPYEVQVYSSTGFRYYFFRQLENMDSYDEVISATTECWSKIDQNIFNNYAQCFESDKQFVMKELGNYTYRPEQPRAKWSEFKYGLWDVHYVKFEKIKEYREILDKFGVMINQYKFDDPVIMLQGIVGTENPMFVGALFGKNSNDMMQQNKKMWNSFGDEGSEMYQKMIPLLRGREKIEFWFRRDLSHFKE